jgi:hypothetical protein
MNAVTKALGITDNDLGGLDWSWWDDDAELPSDEDIIDAVIDQIAETTRYPDAALTNTSNEQAMALLGIVRIVHRVLDDDDEVTDERELAFIEPTNISVELKGACMTLDDLLRSVRTGVLEPYESWNEVKQYVIQNIDVAIAAHTSH